MRKPYIVVELPPEECVDNGWRWLSENFPGWQDRVDRDTLSLGNASDCICGQVFAEAVGAASRSGADGAAPSGYYFVYRILLAEAGSWINAIVGKGRARPLVITETGELSGWTDSHERRASAVVEALGFVPNRDDDQDLPLDRGYDDLLAEWQHRLAEYDVGKAIPRSASPREGA